jgi:hypothetical protein
MEIKRISDFTKLTYEDLRSMTRQELMAIHKQTYVWANNRYNAATDALKSRFNEKKNYPIPKAYRKDFERNLKTGEVEFHRYKKHEFNDFREEDITRGKLLNEVMREKNFLSTSTSTVGGHEQDVREFMDMLKDKFGIELNTRKAYTKFFEVYETLDASYEAILGKYETWREIAQVVDKRNIDNMSAEEIASYLTEKLNRRYEQGVEDEINRAIEQLPPDARELYLDSIFGGRNRKGDN